MVKSSASAEEPSLRAIVVPDFSKAKSPLMKKKSFTLMSAVTSTCIHSLSKSMSR